MVHEELNKVIGNSLLANFSYTAKTFESRLRGSPVGSFYPQFETKGQLLSALLKADWTEVQHPMVSGEGVRCFKATIPGSLGMVELAKLNPSLWVVLEDPKSTGYASCIVDGDWIDDDVVSVNETYMIIGPAVEAWKDAFPQDTHLFQAGIHGEPDCDCWCSQPLLYTVHPGEPVRPSKVGLKYPEMLTVREAIARGFDLAKIDH